MPYKIVFFGDSITAGGRTNDNILGEGYVSVFANRILKDSRYPNLQVINSGINGHTVQDLLQRYKSDVQAHEPQVIVIMIGINDAYNDYISGSENKRIHSFAQSYHDLIHHFRSELPNSKILLCTPYYISDTNLDALYQRMGQYCDIVKDIATEFMFPILDTQRIFDEAVRTKSAKEWANDQIHPLPEGHALLAEHVFDFMAKNVDILREPPTV